MSHRLGTDRARNERAKSEPGPGLRDTHLTKQEINYDPYNSLTKIFQRSALFIPFHSPMHHTIHVHGARGRI